MSSRNDVLSVSDLTRNIKSVLEIEFSSVAVTGEISNFKQHSSGHLYFTLKDDKAQLQAVMWRSRVGHLFFTPQDGMKVVARGSVRVYEVRGTYQIDVTQLQPLGVGELQLAFERLKQRLAEEGLFSQDRKKPLPRYPRRIGIVTSPTGAALRDIITVISRRFPSVELILSPVNVQGVGAAKEIALAIKDFNMYGKVDVMIVGRGGGSLEDLWAFNEEVVARAIAESEIPIISAVGHEIDFTISDFVADLRAPTPSAAAELAIPHRDELVESIRNFCYTAEQFVQGRLSTEKERIIALLRSYSFNRPIDLIRQYSQHLDDVRRNLSQATRHIFEAVQQHFHSLQKRIASVNPDVILERGYTIILRDGKIIERGKNLQQADAVSIKFRDAEVPAVIR